MAEIIILGAGWLGKPLCHYFTKKKYRVEGTSRAPSAEPFMKVFTLEGQQLVHDLTLTEAYWVCAIPPRASDPESSYLSMLDEALNLAKTMKCKGFLLCSSTGVYAEKDGRYDETGTLAAPTSRRIQVLQEAEQKVLSAGGKILRLAGLVGPQREPGQFVAGKVLRSSAQALVNMVHRDDVIAAIDVVLSNWREARDIYNVCYPAHPTRFEYYQAHCGVKGTEMPEFMSQQTQLRVIDGSAIEALGLRYANAI